MIAEMYGAHYAELLKYCGMMCGNASDAEDLTHDVFMKAMRHSDLLAELGQRERRAWLYKTARNLFYDACRKKEVERRHPPEAEDRTDGGFSDVETALVLSCLPEELKRIFIGRHFHGLTSRELAKEYGCSPSGIRAMLARARKTLRETLDG